MPNIKDFMTPGESAAYLDVSKDSLRRWDIAGKLKSRRHPAGTVVPGAHTPSCAMQARLRPD